MTKKVDTLTDNDPKTRVNGSRRSGQRSLGTPALVGALLLIWILALLSGGSWRDQGGWVGSLVLLAGSSWFLLNIYAWWVPEWRQSIVQRRGPLLGLGYAFAAALLSAIVDAFFDGIGRGVALFFLRLVLLLIPFIAPFTVKTTPYPHRVDLAVLVYATVLPWLPGMDGTWFEFGLNPYPGLFFGEGTLSIGPGVLVAWGLIATYFYGARTWTGAPLDLKIRRGDAKHALRTAGMALLGWAIVQAVTVVWQAAVNQGPFTWMQALEGVAVQGSGDGDPGHILALWVVGLAAAIPLEALVVRSVFQAGINHWVPVSWGQKAPKALSSAAAVVAAAVHALLGVYAVGRGAAAFGFALGLAWAFRRSKRFLPAYLGQAIAFALLVGMALILR